jgi:hypothetical protein
MELSLELADLADKDSTRYRVYSYRYYQARYGNEEHALFEGIMYPIELAFEAR